MPQSSCIWKTFMPDPRVVLMVNGRDVSDDPEILNLFDLWTARCAPDMLTRLRSMGKRYSDYHMHGYFNLRGAAIEPRIQFWSYWEYDFFWIGTARRSPPQASLITLTL